MTDSYRMDLDRDRRSYRYYRNAVERHWDPAEIEIEPDREGLVELPPETFERFRSAVARFGAGERAVTDDLLPLLEVVADAEDQLFLTTQVYEEAKHADFFDRYWREVIRPAERDRGLEPTAPTQERWFHPEYDELFERTAEAMARLRSSDTPENRAIALSHYHLTVEGILAQTAYYGLGRTYGPETTEMPHLTGLTTGLAKIRGDEGRHVGWGMAKLRDLVADAVDPQVLHDTVTELLPLVNATTTHGIAEAGEGAAGSEGAAVPGQSVTDLQAYAVEKHRERMAQIITADAEIPDLDSLTALE